MEPGDLFGGGPDQLRGALDRVVSEATMNDEFRTNLLSSPQETLEQFGLDRGLARGVAGEIGLFGGKCEDTCINNTGADCKSDTCRLTDACGWTVCDTTNKQTFLPDDPFNELRIQLNGILEKVAGDDSLKADLLDSPAKTLERLGISGWAVGRVMSELGLGPGKCDDSCINNTGADCKDDTCRLSDACGWTVCGPKTNYMPAGLGDVSAEEFLGGLKKPVTGGELGGTLGGAWPEKKKRELWAEPESTSSAPSADVLAAILARKKQLEREVDPTLGAGREDVLDQLAEAVAERLRRRG